MYLVIVIMNRYLTDMNIYFFPHPNDEYGKKNQRKPVVNTYTTSFFLSYYNSNCTLLTLNISIIIFLSFVIYVLVKPLINKSVLVTLSAT